MSEILRPVKLLRLYFPVVLEYLSQRNLGILPSIYFSILPIVSQYQERFVYEKKDIIEHNSHSLKKYIIDLHEHIAYVVYIDTKLVNVSCGTKL